MLASCPSSSWPLSHLPTPATPPGWRYKLERMTSEPQKPTQTTTTEKEGRKVRSPQHLWLLLPPAWGSPIRWVEGVPQSACLLWAPS